MSLFDELKRRNVFRVGIAYVILGWLLLQVTDVVVPILELPDWVARLVLFLLLIGLPLVLFFAWAYELTPQGVKRERDVDRTSSITHQTGRKLDRVIIGVLAVALAWFAWDRFVQTSTPQESLTAGGEIASTDGKPVVAVLPFLASGSEDGGFLASGLHDDLLTRLAKLGAFQVVSRTSMMEYADRSKNMRQIGEELGASYILEGGVQARGDRVRINAQLILARDDEHLWAETYDRELTAADLFDVQAELAVAIANAMHTTLSPEDRAIVNNVPTQNIDAYNAYLRGLNVWALAGGVGTPADRDAVAAFQQAVNIDPDFAHAWAWLAAAHIKSSGNRFNQEASDAALAAIAKARELQPDLLETEIVWAEYLYRQRQEYSKALQVLESLGDRISGNVYALSLKGYILRRLGRNEDGYRVMQDVWRLEPRSPGTYFDLIVFSALIDECDAAGQHAETLLSLAADVPTARGYVAFYELSCNGNGNRAAELTGDDWIFVGDLPISVMAAFAARDVDRVKQVVAHPALGQLAEGSIWREFDYALLYSTLVPNNELTAQHLDRAWKLMDDYRLKNAEDNPVQYARFARLYYALRKNAEETRSWVEEHTRLLKRETNNDVHSLARNRFWSAYCYSLAGLHDEALVELRELFKNHNGYSFELVNAMPAFDGLREHPEYIALKEQYGD